MTDQEAIKFALEALEKDPVPLNAINNAQYFLRQALAQPEQDHGFETLKKLAGEALTALEKYNRYEIKTDSYDHSTKLIYDLRDVLNHKRMPLREWIGLHLDDIPETFVGDWSFLEGAKWAEAKLKEKNGA